MLNHNTSSQVSTIKRTRENVKSIFASYHRGSEPCNDLSQHQNFVNV